MSTLYPPYFNTRPSDEGDMHIVTHNLDGGLNFPATDEVDERTHRLIMLAFEAGKRKRAKEIAELLGWHDRPVPEDLVADGHVR